jgi:hypothetical protein
VVLDAADEAAQLRRPVRQSVYPALLPVGWSTFRYEADVEVSDATEDADESTREVAPEELPDDALIYTLPSRYCLPDVLGNEAWTLFGSHPRGC